MGGTQKKTKDVKDILLYTLGCLGSRVLLALMTLLVTHKHHSVVGVLLGGVFICVAISLIVFSIVNRDWESDTTSWWKNVRWLNAALYMLAGLTLFSPSHTIRLLAWKILFLDTFLDAMVYTLSIIL